MIAICIVVLMPINVYAQVNNEAKYEITTNEITNWPKGPEILADTGVLIESTTAEVLYDKGMNEKRYPASITKVMTALLAVENSSMDEKLIFSASALEGMYLGTNIGMLEGEVLTMEQCLKALMIRSANEVANQIAEHIGGTQAEFANMMNERAAEIGCQNTHFANASGMPDDNHYSTAYDMALIFREALKNEQFRSLFDTVDFTIAPTNMNPEERYIHSNHHMFVTTVPQHYEGVIGGKTGTTDVSGSTLVTAVERDGIDFIAVVMRTGDHLHCCEDTTKLFDYGYDNFEKINVVEGDLLAPKEATEADFEVVEVEDGNMVKRTYSYNGHLLGTMESEKIEPTEAPVLSEQPSIEEVNPSEKIQQQEAQQGIPTSLLLRRIIVVMSGLIIVGLLLIIIGAIRKKVRRKKGKRQ